LLWINACVPLRNVHVRTIVVVVVVLVTVVVVLLVVVVARVVVVTIVVVVVVMGSVVLLVLVVAVVLVDAVVVVVVVAVVLVDVLVVVVVGAVVLVEVLLVVVVGAVELVEVLVVVVVGAVVLVTVMVVVVVVELLVVEVVGVAGGGHETPSSAARGYCWHTTSSALASPAPSTHSMRSASDVIGSPQSAGQTSHQVGGPEHFWIIASFFASAAMSFFKAAASGHGPGIFPLRTESIHFSIAFSRARKKVTPALAIVRTHACSSGSEGQGPGAVPQSRSAPAGSCPPRQG
jgi:hypothetical protein